MNKAFVREPDSDSRVPCPGCGGHAVEVGAGPLNTHIRPEFRGRLGESAWCCISDRCRVVYFDLFEQMVRVDELQCAVYPYDSGATVCACFGMTLSEIESDAESAEPLRIRELLKKSRSAEVRCSTVAVDGQCCLKEVQRLYLRLRSG